MQSKDRGENNEEFNCIFNAISDAYIKNNYIKIDSDSLNPNCRIVIEELRVCGRIVRPYFRRVLKICFLLVSFYLC